MWNLIKGMFIAAVAFLIAIYWARLAVWICITRFDLSLLQSLAVCGILLPLMALTE